MIGVPLDLAAALIPLVFIVAGLLSAGYRLLVGQRKSTSNDNKVDPNIRVRVTGRIS